MDSRAKAFLEALKDGRWHRKFPQRAITAKVAEACVYLGLAESKLTRIRGSRNSRGSFRITDLGRAALEGGHSPDRYRMSQAIHDATCSRPNCGYQYHWR